jgi:hypothetical protein
MQELTSSAARQSCGSSQPKRANSSAADELDAAATAQELTAEGPPQLSARRTPRGGNAAAAHSRGHGRSSDAVRGAATAQQLTAEGGYRSAADEFHAAAPGSAARSARAATAHEPRRFTSQTPQQLARGPCREGARSLAETCFASRLLHVFATERRRHTRSEHYMELAGETSGNVTVAATSAMRRRMPGRRGPSIGVRSGSAFWPPSPLLSCSASSAPPLERISLVPLARSPAGGDVGLGALVIPVLGSIFLVRGGRLGERQKSTATAMPRRSLNAGHRVAGLPLMVAIAALGGGTLFGASFGGLGLTDGLSRSRAC